VYPITALVRETFVESPSRSSSYHTSLCLFVIVRMVNDRGRACGVHMMIMVTVLLRADR